MWYDFMNSKETDYFFMIAGKLNLPHPKEYKSIEPFLADVYLHCIPPEIKKTKKRKSNDMIIAEKIERAGKNGISGRELVRVTQQIDRESRKDILTSLIDADLINIQKKYVNGSQKPTTFYFWVGKVG